MAYYFKNERTYIWVIHLVLEIINWGFESELVTINLIFSTSIVCKYLGKSDSLFFLEKYMALMVPLIVLDQSKHLIFDQVHSDFWADRAPETTSGKTLFGRGNESLPFYAGEYDKFHKSHFKNWISSLQFQPWTWLRTKILSSKKIIRSHKNFSTVWTSKPTFNVIQNLIRLCIRLQKWAKQVKIVFV